METWLLTVNSYTEAMKGKRFLQDLNIKSDVQKTSGDGGCTYAIKTKHDPHKTARLLSTVGINVKSLRNVRGG